MSEPSPEPVSPENFPAPGDTVFQDTGGYRIEGRFVSGTWQEGLCVVSFLAAPVGQEPLKPTNFNLHVRALKMIPRRTEAGPCVEIVPATAAMLEMLQKNPAAIHDMTPAVFEEFVQDRLDAGGYDTERVGSTNTPDGGVDIIACPRNAGPFPFLLAVQVKHKTAGSVGVSAVRDLRGTLSALPFNAGVLVTNTSFSPDAKWFAEQHQTILHLRDMEDLKRWIENNFLSEKEWRAIPKFIELRPNLRVSVPGRKGR